MSLNRRDLLKLILASTAAPVFGEPLPKFSVCYFDAYPPYSSGSGDHVKGLFIDVLEEVFSKRLHVPIMHTGMPWPRAQALVRAGRADALITTVTPERLNYTHASEEDVFTGELRFYIGANHPQRAALMKLTNLDDAKPYLIGTYRGAGWVMANMKQHRLDMGADLAQCLKKAALSRVDIVPEIANQARTVIRELRLEGEIIELPPVFNTLHYKLLVRRYSVYTRLLSAFDSQIRAMRRDGSLQAIYARYAVPA